MIELNRRVETYLRRSGMTATRFGRDAVGDPRFVFDLRRGRQVGPVVAGRIAAYLEARERRAGR